MADVSPMFRRGSVPAAIDTRFLDHLPSAVLLCDPVSLVIRYANGHAVRLMESVRHMLPLPPDEMVGSALSLLHPAFAEVVQLLEDTGEVARKLILTGRGERLEFHVQALRDMNGRPGFLQVTWSVTTALVAQEDEVARLRQVVEHLPLNVMTCRLSDLTIDYANAAARAAFDEVKASLPGAGETLVGSPVSLFCPSAIVSHVDALPYEANIAAGPSMLRVKATALRGAGGNYLAALLTFERRDAGLSAAPPSTSLAFAPGQSLYPDDVLASLRTSIGRIRTVAETIERMSAPGRPADAPATLPAAPLEVRSSVRIDDPVAVPPNPSAADAVSCPTPPAERDEVRAAPALAYASRFGRRVGRLLRRNGQG